MAYGVQTVIACIIFLVPMLWMVSSSFKGSVDVTAYPPKLFFTPTLDNFRTLFSTVPFFKYLANSIIVAGGSTALGLVLAVPAAFAVSWHRVTWPASVTLFTRMAPGTLFVLPWFIMFTDIHLIGTHAVLVLAHAVITVPLMLWILMPYFDGVPRSIFESAFIDGCQPLNCLVRIGVPLVLPGIVVAVILAFIAAWNYFLFALILGNIDTTTLIVLSFNFVGEGSTNWGALMAAAVLIGAPPVILMFVVQRGLVSGLTGGSVKD
ncbi:MAG TPA: carbohydrate ABC transporter permease [Acetobacteraceae bacterium]